MKPPKLAKYIIKKLSMFRHRNNTLGDLEELYFQMLDDEGKAAADKWYWKQAVSSIPHFFNIIIYWSEIMFKNYTIISFRNFIRNKLFSSINVVGLALGVASCIFILLYIQNELSYDTFQKDYKRIYRIPMIKKTESKVAKWGVNTVQLAPNLKSNFTDIEEIGRFSDIFSSLVKHDPQKFYETVNYADTEFLKIFSVNLVYGNVDGALDRPSTAVLTKDIAYKYFGNKNPVGETIKVDSAEFEITAVVENPPVNSHLKYDILLSLVSCEKMWWYNHWPTGTCFTYVKLKEGIDPREFEEKIKNFGENYSSTFDQAGIKIEYFLQPLSDIHLYSNLDFEHEAPGNPAYIFIFSIVGILVLFIACMNFINLSTAKSSKRANEVGVRKSVGAHQKQIVYQFLYEAVILAVCGTSLAVTIVLLSLPLFNEITGLKFTVSDLIGFKNAIFYLGFSFALGIVSGIYPALIVSSFNPSKILKGNIRAGARNPLFRKILVISQFAISVILIIVTLIIIKQIDYMQFRNLGFDKEEKLVLKFPENGSLRNKYEYVKSEFLQSSGITGATASSHIPGKKLSTARIYLTGKETETGISMEYIYVDYDFFKVFEIPLEAGRFFMKEMGTDTAWGGIVLNEEGMKSFGFRDPDLAVNQRFFRNNIPLLGITKNFHFSGLQNRVGPLYFAVAPWSYKYITLALNGGNVRNTISFIENKWIQLFPNEPLEYFFLDREFNKQYQREVLTGDLFKVFTLMGIFIAGLGLFGLSAYIVEQRKKEIGIRKVLGAGELNIIKIISTEFLFLVVISNLIAWPLAYMAGNKWLQEFAYKTPIELNVFIVSGMLSLLLILFTVGVQALKAARTDPVNAMKYE